MSNDEKSNMQLIDGRMVNIENLTSKEADDLLKKVNEEIEIVSQKIEEALQLEYKVEEGV